MARTSTVLAVRQKGQNVYTGNSLRQTVHTLRASVHQAAKLLAALLRVAEDLAESNGSLPPGLFMTQRHMQADCQEPDQLRNPTLDN